MSKLPSFILTFAMKSKQKVRLKTFPEKGFFRFLSQR
jgi:hypothetical protein